MLWESPNFQHESAHVSNERSNSSASSVKLGGDARSFMNARHGDKNRTVMGRDGSSSSRRNKTGSSSPCKCKTFGSAGKITARRRRKSSSHTKCSNIMEVHQPLCSHSAQTGFYSTGVTQIYPRFKEIDSIMMTGLAAMAARGEKVQCECSHTYHTPKLLKHTVFPTQSPNQILFQSEVMHSKQSSNRKTEVTKRKVSLKSRFKKFIFSTAESKKGAVQRQGDASKSSSLSLSSSSSGSKSSASVNAYKVHYSGKCIYPTVSSITENHIPKSPSATDRLKVIKPKQTTPSGSSSSLLSSAVAKKKLSKWNV